MVREFLAVLVRAVLQWALASLLLANGAAFCLIAAVASSLRLGPPCLLCARVHRLISSDAGCSQEQQEAFRRLLCDAHVAAIARPQPERPTSSPSDSNHVDRGTKHHSDKPGGNQSIDCLFSSCWHHVMRNDLYSLVVLLENSSISTHRIAVRIAYTMDSVRFQLLGPLAFHLLVGAR